ncbi:MAG: Crp/Fnr family transcriptional regulator [Deltaproteobacteria bacterium]
MDPVDLEQRFGHAFSRGTVLFREGDPGREMYVIHRGKVEISRSAGRVEKVLSTLGQGEFFGEMAILNDAPRSATATCVEDCSLLIVDARTFEAMVRANSEIALRMFQRMAARLAEANRQIEMLLLRDPRSRVVHYVIREGARRPGLPLKLSPAEMARELDVEPAQVADLIGTLQRSGLLSGEEGAFSVPDLDRLRHFLELLQDDARSGPRP